jgi:protein Cut8
MGSAFHNQYSLDSLSPGKDTRMNYSRFTNQRKNAMNKRKHNDLSDYNNFSNLLINSKNRIVKKQKNPNQLFGQKLSLSRIIETLDKEKLQDLINNLITESPELTTKLIDASPVITPEDSLNELKRKLDLILMNIPYKVESTSDYSFLRVKPLVNEFFQALSDYSLNFIPPIENNLIIPISFLKNFLLEIFHKLPQFNAVEFKYFYSLTIEKFNLIFSTTIVQFLNEKKQNLLLIINENWIDDFKKINQLNNNNFIKIQNFLQNEIDNYYNSGSVILNNDSLDNKTNITENKLTGLDGLLNFAYQNNTLSNIIDNV